MICTCLNASMVFYHSTAVLNRKLHAHAGSFITFLIYRTKDVVLVDKGSGLDKCMDEDLITARKPSLIQERMGTPSVIRNDVLRVPEEKSKLEV